MNNSTVVFVLAGVVVVAIALGLVARYFDGRKRRFGPDQIVRLDGVELGSGATLLQFSTAVCAPCAATSKVLHEFATASGSVKHAEIDITARPDIAARFNILQTPTTFVLDATGVLRARFGGSVRRDLVAAELDFVLSPV